ncbi:hypothetical protein QMG90_02390 [Trabulsiella odontotermitis]|nr:hypothetical protein [Trabulsiella odontotermitis]WHP31822.1 hypothetical protein QMG90_02390 [Trabulsiella odontotermitis]
MKKLLLTWGFSPGQFSFAFALPFAGRKLRNGVNPFLEGMMKEV